MAELIPTATAEKNGLMSAYQAKAIGNTSGISLTKNKYLEICDIPTGDWYGFIIDITMIFNPGWDMKVPLKIIISPTSETSGKGIKWKCYCGDSSYVKFYKANNKLYMATTYNYNTTLFVSINGSKETYFIGTFVDNISDGQEIKETA